MNMDLMMVAFGVGILIYAGALGWMIATGVGMEEPTRSFVSWTDAQKAQHVARESMLRQPDEDDLATLINTLPVDRRDDWSVRVEQHLAALKRPRRQLAQLDSDYKDLLVTGDCTDEDCLLATQRYAGVTALFMKHWEQLGVLKGEIRLQARRYRLESARQVYADVTKILFGLEVQLQICSLMFDVSEDLHRLVAHQRILNHIGEQLGKSERRSLAVEQLDWLERKLKAQIATGVFSCRSEFVYAYQGVFKDITESINWLEAEGLSTSSAQKLRWLRRRIVQVGKFNNQEEAIAALREIDTEAAGIMHSVYIVRGIRTGEIALPLAA